MHDMGSTPGRTPELDMTIRNAHACVVNVCMMELVLTDMVEIELMTARGAYM